MVFSLLCGASGTRFAHASRAEKSAGFLCRKFAANATAVLSYYDGLDKKTPSNPIQALLSCARFSPKLVRDA